MNSYQAVLSPAGIWSIKSITPIPLGIPIESPTRLHRHLGGEATALAVGVPEVAPGRHTIADELFQLLCFWEATLLGAREKELAIEAYFENAPFTWHENHFAELRVERRKQLLRDPRGAQ